MVYLRPWDNRLLINQATGVVILHRIVLITFGSLSYAVKLLHLLPLYRS